MQLYDRVRTALARVQHAGNSAVPGDIRVPLLAWLLNSVNSSTGDGL